MGTRSLTIVQEREFKKKGKKVIETDKWLDVMVLYRQWDGYITGHGQELIDFINNKMVTNGIPFEDGKLQTENRFNGEGCLAASIVAHFKDEAGSFYLYPSGTRDCGEEYIYILRVIDEKIKVLIYVPIYNSKYKRIGERLVWQGYPEEFDAELVQNRLRNEIWRDNATMIEV